MIVGALVVFGAGFLIGLAVGRSRGDREVVRTQPAPSPTLIGTATVAPPVVTPTPGREPAIPTQGAILAEGDRPVVAAGPAVACQSLVTPGTLGECGEVPVAGARVVWVVERASTAGGATATTARVLSYVPDESGWVEWLRADDAAGELWSDVNVLALDLTADGVSELVVGFRGTDARQTLEYDIVGYGQDNLPVVLAHPDPAARGVVLAGGGAIAEYAAQYPNGEPDCCPASYLHRTIAFVDGFFRVTLTEPVSPTLVPPSQL